MAGRRVVLVDDVITNRRHGAGLHRSPAGRRGGLGRCRRAGAGFRGCLAPARATCSIS
ncbi:MAG: hypothetical protein WDN06_14760 [Asticcacaulis sp.]